MNCLTGKLSIDKSRLVWYNTDTIKKGMNNMYAINSNFITYLKSRQRSENTIKAYVKNINAFFDFVNKPDNEVTAFDVMNWMNSLSDKSSSTVCQMLSSIKAYFDFLFTFELVDKDPTARIKPPHKTNKPKQYMNAKMVKDMVACCNNSRDRAILYTYASTGLRVSELIGLTLKQYQDMKANGNNVIKITGKGNKERFVPFNQETQTAIDDYIKTRSMSTVHSDKLFLSHYGNDIARNNLSMTLKGIAKKAGIPFWNEVCNHSMRSACASIYGEAGVPVADIRDLLGHSDLAVTSRYIKTSVENVSNAVMNMSFNFC